MLTKDGERVYTFGPQELATAERWRARFNAFYQGKESNEIRGRIDLKPEDMERYREAKPEEAAKLDLIRGAARITRIGTLTGLVGAMTTSLRMSKFPPLIAVSTLVGGVAGFFVSADIGSWAYGTYKFDRGDANLQFLRWVEAERKAS